MGCMSKSKYEERYTLSPGSDLVIPLKENSRNFSSCIQYFIQNGTSYLAVKNDNTNSIGIYNLDNKELSNLIKIQTEGENMLFNMTGFLMFSLDSVYAITSMPKMIGLVNSYGEVLKKISYDMDINGRHTVPTLAFGRYHAILKGSTLFLSQEYRTHSTSGILTDSVRMTSYICVSVNVNNGECVSSELTYPEELIGKDVSGMEVTRTIGYDGTFIYHFGIIEALFLTKDHQKFKKVPLETNYYLRFEEIHFPYIYDMINGVKSMLEHDKVYSILYDQYREIYYIIVRKRENRFEGESDFMTKFMYPHSLIIILDKDFKHLGELVLPENQYSCQMVFVAPEGLYISDDHPNNPDFDEDFMRFRLFKLTKL
jgi:hypothetical protein